MCQIFKFKYYTINQMSYIGEFLGRHLQDYFFSTLKRELSRRDFLDYNHPHNLFTLISDLALLASRAAPLPNHPHALIATAWLPYEALQDAKLPWKETDSETVALLKSSLPYSHMQMLQLQLRVLTGYLGSDCPEETTAHLREISYIYPALKIEVISNPDIHLLPWLEKILTPLLHSQTPLHFHNFVLRMVDSCNFIGPTERLCKRLLAAHHPEEPIKRIDASSNDSECQSELRQKENDSDKTKETVSKGFSDVEMFRRKKKRPFRVIQETNVTPVKQRVGTKCTPRTEKTEDMKKLSDSKSPTKPTPLFKKIRKQKKLERTIYYYETKKFMPKKPSSADLFIEHVTNTSLASDSHSYFDPPRALTDPPRNLPFFDPPRKIDRKFTKGDIDDFEFSAFCVPETPRPLLSRKPKLEKRTCSMDQLRGGIKG